MVVEVVFSSYLNCKHPPFFPSDVVAYAANMGGSYLGGNGGTGLYPGASGGFGCGGGAGGDSGGAGGGGGGGLVGGDGGTEDETSRVGKGGSSYMTSTATLVSDNGATNNGQGFVTVTYI